MPPLIAILPTIAAVAGLAGTGVGLGLELSNQGGSPAATTTAPTPAAINAQQTRERAAISQQAPNILAETSGLANPDYVAQLSQLLAQTGGQTGSTGAANSVAAQLFGISPGSVVSPGTSFTPAGAGQTPNPAAASSPENLSDFVNRFIYS